VCTGEKSERSPFPFVDDIEDNATRQLKAIPKYVYQMYFRQWQERWNMCIQTKEHYFEGDKTN